MKKNTNLNRREFLNVGSKLVLTLPVAYAFGCASEKTLLLNPEDSLKKLILLLGPWPAAEKSKADDFANRFLKAKPATAPYLPESGKLVQNLAKRFPAESMAINQINLQNLPIKEKELLVNLTKQLYSYVEVRFDVANEPPWGHCQGDRLWHTRAPVHSKI